MALEYFQIKERDYDLIEQLIRIEQETYNEGVMGEPLDVFELIAMLRHARVYVAVETNDVLGYVYFVRNFDEPDKAFLHSIKVVDRQATPNLGVSLLNISFGDMKASGIRAVEVNVDASNLRALKIYRETLGFVPSDSIQNDLLGGKEMLMLQKEL